LFPDSLAREDTLGAEGPAVDRYDTTHTLIPFLLSRAFAIGVDSSMDITSGEFRWFGHRYSGEIIGGLPGVYLRDPASEGQYSQLNFRGADWRSLAVLADGRSMNDPASGIYNLYYYASDYPERIEVITGPRSFLYGMNAAGGVVHYVSRHFDTNRPFSKLNYTEGPYGYGYVDGSMTQNVTEAANVTLGFQRQVTDGRYDNGAHEAWNLRARLRYRFSDRFFAVLSEYYTNTKSQLHGGIAPDDLSLANAFFPLETSVRNGDSYEKVNRHDVDLSFVGYFISDSANASRLSFFYSHSLREYRDETGGAIPNSVFIQSDHRSSWMGARFSQELGWAFHRLNIDANLELRQIEGSPNLGRRRNVFGSVSATEELFITDVVTVAGFGRYDRYLNKDYFGFGSDVTLRPLTQVKLFAGGSFSWRMPNYQELYWADSTVGRSPELQEEEHRHIEVGGEVSFPDIITLRAAYFNRRVVHPILVEPFTGSVFPGLFFTNGDEIVSQGIDLRIRVPVWLLSLEGTATYLLQQSGDTTREELPQYSGSAGVFFQKKLIDDHLHLRTGFQARFQSVQQGTEFNAEVLAYVRNVHQPLDGGASIDFVLIAGIGDAYVHLIWENLMESEYFGTPFYPVKDRAVRFGISWQFLD
jgi:outer membrane cobalamin receptor